eukprot:s401_g20.t1
MAAFQGKGAQPAKQNRWRTHAHAKGKRPATDERWVPAFAPQLLSLLGAEGAPGHLRASAIQALGRIGLAAGVETCSLISYCCTQDPEGSVREAACVALGLFAKEAKSGAFQGADELLELARPALASALDSPPNIDRRKAAEGKPRPAYSCDKF